MDDRRLRAALVGWRRGAALLLLACAACNQREPPRPPFDPYAHGLMPPLDAPDAANALVACGVSTPSGDRGPYSVHINEAFAGSLLDDQDDWFEIHNAGQQPVALDGWTVEDFFTGNVSKGVPGRFEFPPDTVLCPGHFLALRRGDACEADANTFDFGLGNTDRLVLADASGAVVDDVEWELLPQGQSVGRVDDGPGAFRRLAMLTPGVSNSEECECCGECLFGRCELRDGVCVVGSEEDCRTSVACMQLGWCGLQDGHCMALDDESCQQSELCWRRGRCGPRAGACEVVADSDCRGSKVCENEGRCSADLDAATCIATSQVDCEASDDCVHMADDGSIESMKQRCTLSGQRCVATSCEDTSVCAEKMCCSLVDGKCVRL